jgi:hypothetical protein
VNADESNHVTFDMYDPNGHHISRHHVSDTGHGTRNPRYVYQQPTPYHSRAQTRNAFGRPRTKMLAFSTQHGSRVPQSMQPFADPVHRTQQLEVRVQPDGGFQGSRRAFATPSAPVNNTNNGSGATNSPRRYINSQTPWNRLGMWIPGARTQVSLKMGIGFPQCQT